MDYQEEKTMFNEAITHAREIAKKNYLQGMLCHANPDDEELDGYIERGREHEQIAKWLEELMQYKQIGTLKEVRESMHELQMYKSNKLVLIPDDVHKRQCEELDKYKQIGTLEEIKLLKATHLT